jgi:RNA polymerase sigma-70 factor (ECF subfamily)
MDGSLHAVPELAEPIPEAAAESGDEALEFEAFVLANHTRLFRALCLLTRDRYEAEEITQESYLRILERWDRVRSLEDPVGYLYRTAMNVFRKRYRRAKLALHRMVALAPREDEIAAAEEHEVVLHALAALPADQRAALVVTSMLGYSSEEAAEVLGAKPSTVRARSTRARDALRRRIGEQR